MTTTAQPQASYPASLNIDYEGTGRDRLTAFFRAITSIPILIIISVFGSGTNGIILFPTLLMILFQQKYPKWWFDFNIEYQRFSTRIGAYMMLLTDTYPSTDEEQSVHLDIDYPDATKLNRFLPLFKWILAIPHYIAIAILGVIALILTVVAWFIILFTGNFPKGIHDFNVGVSRWTLRVTAYAFLLTTDDYPPFSLE